MGLQIAQFYILIALIGFAGPVVADSVHADLRLAGVNVMNQANPAATLGASIDYNFFADYSLGIDYSYTSPFTEFKDYISKGLNDLGLSLADKSIWADKPYEVTVSGQIGALLPLSEASRTSSMTYGLTGGLSVKKGFGKRFSFTYSLTGEYFDHVYQTAVEDEKSVIFNTRFDVINKVAWTFNLLSSLQAKLALTMGSYYNYSSELSNVYSLGCGMSYDFSKNSSFDIGFRTSMQNPSTRVIWNGPSAGSRFFRPEGSLITLGTTIAI